MMIPTLFVHQLYSDVVNTVVGLVILSLIYIVVNVVYARSTDSQRQRKRFRTRSFYITMVIFLFLVTRIWIEGFTHIFTILGLVSAGLVVTNKESIMNFAGWLVIMWRELFSENDLIQIQGYKGFVKSIGVLYFVLSEVNENSTNILTGKNIRVANGLVITNIVINYSQTSHLLEHSFSIIITPSSDLQKAVAEVHAIVKKILLNYYGNKREYSVEYILQKNRGLPGWLTLEPIVTAHPKPEKPAGIQITAAYYCFSNDHQVIQQSIWREILTAFQGTQNKNIELCYEGFIKNQCL